MSNRRLGAAIGVLAAATAAFIASGAGAAGPTPGTMVGWDGIANASGSVRYVTVTSVRDTILEKIRTSDGRVLRFGSIRGIYGVPLASYDGTATGLTRDGRSLVLSTFPVPTSAVTRLVVLDTRTLKVRQRVTLRGLWSLDALSPDGKTLFLIEYLPQDGNYAYYRVRAYDLRTGQLVGGAIVDKREPEAMTGLPMTRVASADATWAYTLYSRDAAPAFIHALDTQHRAAVCIDLPWAAGPDALSRVRMSLGPEGLVLSQRGVGRLAVVDLRTFTVHALRAPVAPVG